MEPPPIPRSASNRLSAPGGARRRSLPLPPPKLKSAHGRPPANQVNLESASPEVISSLISSLSAISLPASEHFEAAPPNIWMTRSTPSSPNAHGTTFSTAPSKTFFGRGSASLHPNSANRLGSDANSFYDPQEYLHSNEAATPPVVRTSRRSSAHSPYTPPHSPTFWKKCVRGGGMFDPQERDDSESIGSPNIDPLEKLRNSSMGHAPGDDKKPSKAQKGLAYMTSKEHLRRREAVGDHPSEGTIRNDGLGLGVEIFGAQRSGSPAPGPTIRSANKLSIKTEPLPFDLPPEKDTPFAFDAKQGNDILNSIPDALDLSSSSPATQNVPARESSLLKTGRAKKTRRSNSDRVSKPLNGAGEAKASKLLPGDTSSGLQERENASNVNDHPESHDAQGGKKTRWPVASTLSGRVAKERGSKSMLMTDRPSTAPEDLSEQITHLQQNSNHDPLPEPDESAPAPAILQRRKRDNDMRRASDSPHTMKSRNTFPLLRSTPASQSPLATPPVRKGSRGKRQSQAADPKGLTRHYRTFSNPLGRNSTSSAPQKSPQLPPDDRPSSADSVEDAVEAYLCSPRLSQKIRHPETGRVISFSEVGDSEGFAVFCCVGMGLTRYITAFYDELALTLKLRLITPDRPGVGASEAYNDGTATPLVWPDDVHAICQALKITKFSILAHSAGAIYALATALRMSQHIRGRIHLLAPWIPPSQLAVTGSQQDLPHAGVVPTSQRILRALPTPILRVANSSFMSATSSSITRSVSRSPRRKRKGVAGRETPAPGPKDTTTAGEGRDSLMFPRPEKVVSAIPADEKENANPSNSDPVAAAPAVGPPALDRERQSTYDSRLAHAIWDLATSGANPAVDLLVCLERRQPIGFRYVDITRAVVIHHGSRDTRVPVENVKWLGKAMKRCEVRVLEGEGHGLMASATVMGSVLMEISKEWEDWTKVVQQGQGNGNGRRGTLVGKASEWGI